MPDCPRGSGGFLVLQRLNRLRKYVEAMHALHPDEVPTLEWGTVETVLEVLWPIYLEEMILQRDSSSLIHLSHSFDVVERHLLKFIVGMERRNQPGDAATAARLRDALDNRMELMRSSGVQMLCSLMWPDPIAMRQENVVLAFAELDIFVRRQFPVWHEKQQLFGMSAMHHLMSVDEFVGEVRAELTVHITGDNAVIKGAREVFRSATSAFAQSLEATGKVPTPKAPASRGLASSNVRKYWNSVFPAVPALHFVAKVLCQ